MKHTRLLIIGVALNLFALGSLLPLYSGQAEAVSATGFQAGRIMDDNVFFDGNSMSIPTIQAFLNSKVPTCDTNGAKASSHGMSRAAWGTKNGYPPPYTCLKDYMTDVWGTTADQYCNTAIGYGKYSAAGIIYSVGKACNVSPKVLLVLLQKEQGLVTDDWPWSNEYDAATGYACYDNGQPCVGAYSGLFNQVYYAARQYKMYAQKPQLFNHQRGVTRDIAYSTDPSCGKSGVAIQNQVTAGLYNYTPYQPNRAALNAGYGTAPCGSYGNRNFWLYYNDWFGNTYGIPYSAAFVRESSAAVSVANGQSANAWFDLQNTGAFFWKDDSSALPYYPRTRLMGAWPINRASIFDDLSTWLSPSRPVSNFAKVFESDGTTLAADQHTVWPGQIARFQFTLKYPGDGVRPGNYAEHFSLVEDGAPNFWVPGSDVWQMVSVAPPFQAAFAGNSPAANISPGHDGTLWFKYKNTGSQFWKDDSSALPYYPRTRLTGSWPINRVSAFYDPSTWLSPSRPVSNFSAVYESDGTTLAADQHTVWPGQIAKFQFPVKYPTGGIAPGTYKENFELTQDGAPNWWTLNSYAWQAVNVSP